MCCVTLRPGLMFVQSLAVTRENQDQTGTPHGLRLVTAQRAFLNSSGRSIGTRKLVADGAILEPFFQAAAGQGDFLRHDQ